MSERSSVKGKVPSGTVIKVGGLPFKLERDARVSGSPENFSLMRKFLESAKKFARLYV